LPDLPTDTPEVQLTRLQQEADTTVEQWVDQIRTVVMEAGSLDELRARLETMAGDLDDAAFAQVMTDALAAAHLAGRYDILEGL
jgi:phage gp29-like protein